MKDKDEHFLKGSRPYFFQGVMMSHDNLTWTARTAVKYLVKIVLLNVGKFCLSNVKQ